MVNEHVKDLRYSQYDQGNLSDDDVAYGADEDMTLHDWEAYYERDLFNMWNNIKGYTMQTGSANYMMNFALYTDFVEFCYKYSNKKMYMSPVGQ